MHPVTIAKLAALAVLVCLAAGAPTASATTRTLTDAQAVPAGTFNGCPRGALPLSRPLNAYAPALRRTVLHFVATTLARKSKNAKQLVGARVTDLLFTRRWLPSGWIRMECGRRVWLRSVAVQVYFPALDLPHNPIGHCNACAVLTLIASRIHSGWTVWGEY